ncbi:DUF4129 domain-containing protein [Wukongibacter baidiensis]|uniref:DUF4129 domain-containing protein n=1 Tax=Wukongibacter baidiensis TaxID=1723361 RepID=UPI003D7FA855
MRDLLHILMTPRKEKFDETIEEILQKLEYRHLRDYADLMERLKEKIVSWIETLLRSIHFDERGIVRSAPSISNGVIIIGCILIALIVVLIVLSIKRMVKKEKKVIKILGEIIDEKTTKESLKDRAKRLKDLGEYREALRYGFIALLLQMKNANLLYLDETQTNSELTRALRKSNFKGIELFESVTGLFNKVWYGHKEIDEETYESWENMLLVLENGVYAIEDKK